MLTLIKEDGTGKVDANSYADVAEGDAFHEAHLYAADWTGSSAANKAVALVMATRLIDAHYQFRGFKAHDTQALQCHVSSPAMTTRCTTAYSSASHHAMSISQTTSFPSFFATRRLKQRVS